LTRLSIQIGYAGIFVSLATFLALLIRFLIIDSDFLSDYKYVTQQIIDFVIVSISILVLAIPEGLPLAVTISLAYAVKVTKYPC
jgi:magnesium-transporting ATPase (P-type)